MSVYSGSASIQVIVVCLRVPFILVSVILLSPYLCFFSNCSFRVLSSPISPFCFSFWWVFLFLVGKWKLPFLFQDKILPVSSFWHAWWFIRWWCMGIIQFSTVLACASHSCARRVFVYSVLRRNQCFWPYVNYFYSWLMFRARQWLYFCILVGSTYILHF